MMQNVSIIASSSGDNMTDMESEEYTSGSGYDYEEYGEDYDLWEEDFAYDVLYRYLPLVILIPGLFGNVLSFIVFSMKSMTSSVSSVYFRALAVTDSAVLMLALTRYWVMGLTDENLRDAHVVLCKMHPYLLYFAKDMSGLILATIATERCLGVNMPHKSKILFTKKRATILLIGLVFVVALINIFIPLSQTMDYFTEENTTYTECIISEKYEHVHKNIWPFIDLFKFSLIPFVIIFICNICIVKTVVSAAKKRKLSVSNHKQTQKNLSGMTTILMTVSLVYLVCSMPLVIYFILERSLMHEETSDKVHGQLTLFHFAGNLIFCLNSAINFVLYCISGPKFRKVMKSLFVSAWKGDYRRGSNTTNSTSANKSHSSSQGKGYHQTKL